MLHFQNLVFFLGGKTYAASPSAHPKLLAAPYTLGRVSAGENFGVIGRKPGLFLQTKRIPHHDGRGSAVL
jgi:hypothetical protein